MEIKPLVFKSYDYVKWINIRKKYNNEYNTTPVLLTEIELKSILALLFSIRYNYPIINEKSKDEIKFILIDEHPITRIPSVFGHQMLENLDKEHMEWFNRLHNKSYLLSEIFNDSGLNEFVHLALIDYMAIRKFEYGKFFLNKLSKSIFDSNEVSTNSITEKIKDTLNNTSNKLEFIADKILKANPMTDTKDLLIMSFAFNEYFSKSSNKDAVYAITNYIVKENIYLLSIKKNIFKEAINKTMKRNWNLNRGRGGHKL